MKLISCFLIILLCTSVQCSQEFCSADKELCEQNLGNKYTEDLNEKYHKYYKLVEDAEANYVECNITKLQCYEHVIVRDLKPFQKQKINRELIEQAKSRGIHYQIIDHKLYREHDCMFPSRCSGIEHFLTKISDKLPDMDLVINTRDYPQSSIHFGEPLPIFSFSKTMQYYDITYPAWSFWEGGPAIALYPRGLGRWDHHRESINKASKDISWDEKENKAFFRGSRTSSERDNLILLSRSKPHLVDAQYTKNQAWKSDTDTLHVAPATEIPLESHCKYKYLFNYRGVAASFRHKHLFLCRSLVFHVGHEWEEFYYSAMKPWIHYVPVPKDATQSQLEELILFAQKNDDIAKKIAFRGRNFVWEKLRMKDVIQFWKKLLKSYVKLLTYKPVLNKTYIRVHEK